MALFANHWKLSGRLQDASENRPAMRQGETDHVAVGLLQQALILTGFPIPSGPTGNYREETAAAIRRVQERAKREDPSVRQDGGVAGREVLTWLDTKLRALTSPIPTAAPIVPFWIGTPEYASLIAEINRRYRDSPFRLDDANVLVGLVREDYPGLAGIHPPGSYADVLRLYLPEDWQSRVPDFRTALRLGEQPAFRQGSARDEQFRLRPGQLSPAEQILADLDTLRFSPVAALTFIVLSCQGLETAEAMDWSRAAGNAADLLLATGRGMVATSRAVSGNTGQTRDARQLRGQFQVEAEMARPRIASSPPPPVPTPPPRPPRTPRPRLFGLQPPEVRRLLVERYGRNPATGRR